MKECLDKLSAVAEKFAKTRKEKSDLKARAADANQEIEKIASATLDESHNAVEIQALTERISIIQLRLERIERQMPTLLQEYRAALREADDTWTAAVKVSAALWRKRFVKHCAGKFYKGDLEAAHYGLLCASIPGESVDEKFWAEDGEIAAANEERLPILASRFIQKVKFYLPSLLSPELEKP
jgi:hypothetical protein